MANDREEACATVEESIGKSLMRMRDARKLATKATGDERERAVRRRLDELMRIEHLAKIGQDLCQ